MESGNFSTREENWKYVPELAFCGILFQVTVFGYYSFSFHRDLLTGNTAGVTVK